MNSVAEHTSKVADIPALLNWGVATQAFDGCAESGDGYMVAPFADGTLVVVVDGLGHGPRAATATRTALATLEGRAHEPVTALLKQCHEGLKRTRGVVMSLASFSALEGTMTWLGVGNVKGLLLCNDSDTNPKRERLLLRGGVVGYQLPTLRPEVIRVKQGDTLVFATDGLRSIFAEELTLGEPPQDLADRILGQHRRGTDDALVLVAQYVGP
jgi:negative regulator of sigma-B (phosphoserine phosphatase)